MHLFLGKWRADNLCCCMLVFFRIGTRDLCCLISSTTWPIIYSWSFNSDALYEFLLLHRYLLTEFFNTCVLSLSWGQSCKDRMPPTYFSLLTPFLNPHHEVLYDPRAYQDFEFLEFYKHWLDRRWRHPIYISHRTAPHRSAISKNQFNSLSIYQKSEPEKSDFNATLNGLGSSWTICYNFRKLQRCSEPSIPLKNLLYVPFSLAKTTP